jgi:hypothetical protein
MYTCVWGSERASVDACVFITISDESARPLLTSVAVIPSPDPSLSELVCNRSVYIDMRGISNDLWSVCGDRSYIYMLVI